MAKEIKVNLGTTGLTSTLYGTLYNDTMQPYNAATPGFETYNPANYTASQYCALLWTEVGSNGIYTLDFPALIPAGYYWLDMRVRAGSVPSESDTTQLAELYPLVWDGTQVVDALRLTSPMKKNQAFANFCFVMVSSTDHLSAYTGGVSGTVSLDGGVPSALSAVPNLVSAVEGLYKVSFSAADLNGTSVVVIFTGSGADKRRFEFLLEP